MEISVTQASNCVIPGAQPGGGIWPPEIFKPSHSNFVICRNFQRIKMKFCIQIIFEKSLIWIFLCPTGKLSPYKIYLETSHLMENFVNVWYLTTNMLELWKLGRSFKMLVFLRHFFILLLVYHSERFQKWSVYAFILFLAYLLRNRVCMHSRNVNNKYFIVITPLEQSFKVCSQ